MGDVQVRVLCGADIAPYRDAVAALRIKVFRDFPYLYDGDLDFEAKYLRVYAESSRSVFASSSALRMTSSVLRENAASAPPVTRGRPFTTFVASDTTASMSRPAF